VNGADQRMDLSFQILGKVFKNQVKDGWKNVIYCATKSDLARPEVIEYVKSSGPDKFEKLFGHKPGKLVVVNDKDANALETLKAAISDSINNKEDDPIPWVNMTEESAAEIIRLVNMGAEENQKLKAQQEEERQAHIAAVEELEASLRSIRLEKEQGEKDLQALLVAQREEAAKDKLKAEAEKMRVRAEADRLAGLANAAEQEKLKAETEKAQAKAKADELETLASAAEASKAEMERKKAEAEEAYQKKIQDERDQMSISDCVYAGAVKGYGLWIPGIVIGVAGAATGLVAGSVSNLTGIPIRKSRFPNHDKCLIHKSWLPSRVQGLGRE